MKMFDKDGRLLIPLSDRKKVSKKEEQKVRYIINHAYCPNGHSIMNTGHKINGFPGLHIKFIRPGMEGEFVISAIEGSFEKIVLSGKLIDGEKDELLCPHCGIVFRKLVNCNCSPNADMVVIGLTPELDFNDAITFCNVTGCENGTFIKSGDAIRHIRLSGSF